MPTIPIGAIPSVQAAPVAGARVDPSTFTAPYMARAQAGQQVTQSVASAISAYQQKSSQIKDAGDIAKAKLEMSKAEADLDQMQVDSPDFDTWEKGAEDRMRKARAAIFEAGYSKTMSPELRRQLEADVELWATRQQTGIKYAATKARNKDAENSLTTLANLEYQNGNREGGDAIVDQLVTLGIKTKNDGETSKIVGQRSADVARAKGEIMANPYTAEESLTKEAYPSLSQTDLLSLQKTAREEASAARAETVRNLSLAAETGSLREQDIDNSVERREITPQQGKWLKRQITGEADYQENMIRTAELSRRITAWSPADKDAKEKLNAITADMAGLPKDLRDPLETRLITRASGDVKEASVGDAERYVDRLYSAGFFGNIREQGVNDDEPGAPFDRAGYVRANEQVVQLKAKLSAWVKDHPGASAAEQVEFINKEIKGDRSKRGATTIINASSGRAR